MSVLFVDIYAAGVDFNFEDKRHYLIAACGMTSSGICKVTSDQSLTVFSVSLTKLCLRFGFSHTIVVLKDSKFLGEFIKTSNSLKINMHVLSGNNHEPMTVDHTCIFLITCLTIFYNEHGNTRVALEGIPMSLYALNAVPVVGTDISCSLLMTGRELNFPFFVRTASDVDL
jgi:hypothetical protein